jgi:hypothetical protein
VTALLRGTHHLSALVDEPTRFWINVDGEGADTCWIWRGCRFSGSGGYGLFPIRGKSMKAHRWSYEFMVGAIPEGLQLDHLCRNRACVNPWHLEPVTARVNNSRSQSLSALQSRQTHCLHGHEFTEANTRRTHGRRYCISCYQNRLVRAREETSRRSA